MSVFLGPNSAFSAFTATSSAPRRRAPGAKEEGRPGPPSAVNGGPAYVPSATPSLGAYTTEHHDGYGAESRSFSSILSPAPPSPSTQEPLDPSKPFVYSREFLLSLYDGEKSSRRPIELARHDIGTRDTGSKPWGLTEWREGEKELFATSIHPPTSRSSRTTVHRTESYPLHSPSTSTSNTLDLASLAQLPRERDRAAANGMGGLASPRANGGLMAGIGNTAAAAESDALARRNRAAGGPGVLAGTPSRPLGPSATKSTPGSGSGSKEVWQGGRWRRGGTAEVMDTPESNRSAALGTRRYGTDASDSYHANGDATHEDVPTTWDGEDESVTNQSASAPTPSNENETRSHDASFDQSYLAERDLDLDHRGHSVIGSLSLDPPLHDSPLPPPTRAGPPGLGAPNPETVLWHYRDPAGVVQGPFAGAMMHDWYAQNFFAGDLLVKRVQELEFEMLQTLIRRCGDGERPFLTAPLQLIAPPPLPLPQTNWQAAPQLDQFGQPQRFGAYYENFASPSLGGAFDAPRPASQQSFGYNGDRRTAGLDPWGAPLPSTAAAGWQDGSNMFANDGRYAQGTYQQQYEPQQQLRQQPTFQPELDAFGRQTAPRLNGVAASPFFDPSQLSTATPDWNRLNAAPMQQSPTPQSLQPQQPLQIAPIGQNSWSSLISPSLQTIVDDRTLLPVALAPLLPQPIGPPASQQSSPKAPVVETFVEPAAPVVSPWTAVPAPVEIIEPVVEAPVVVEKVVEVKVKAVPAPPAPAPAPVVVVAPIAVAPVAPAPVKTPATAPWTKDDSRPVSPVGPSLRQIQEAEARQSEIRKAAERQASARAQAIAAVQAAQRAAAAEAESLPSSSTWAEVTPTKPTTPAAAPWGSKAVVGKTMKEIQEEEELRRKQAVVVTAGPAVSAGVRGYAGSIGQAKPVPGAPWTTVGAKPVAAPVVATVRPVIPGGPAAPIRVVSSSPLPVKPVPSALRSTMTVSVPARPTPRVAANGSYDADSPPPPSSEFMKWCRDALKGLTVPMDEFIQMLLSFPLEASADVLEIISDSVYANSSTLDGRRFANDYCSRRKLDVAARYPNIVLSKTLKNGKPTSMAEALKRQPEVKTPEWAVKVAGGKKKKGGK